MKSQQRAAFIWSVEKDTVNDLNILCQHVMKAESLGLDTKVWGPEIIKTLNDPSDPRYNLVTCIRPFYDDLPTYNILKTRCFNYSQTSHLTGEYLRAWIVIDDWSQLPQGDTQFEFGTCPPPPGDSYILPFTILKKWLDDTANMNVVDLCLVIRGQNSGKALVPLWDPKRYGITSMTHAELQNPNDPDQFNMALHLDETFNWRGAFEAEQIRLSNYQTPRILPQ